MKASRRNNSLTIVILFLVILILSAKAGFSRSFKYSEALEAKNEDAADLSSLLTGEFYFYTASGQKYHLDPECRYLKKAKNVNQSDKYYLKSESRQPCSACAGGNESDAEETSGTEETISEPADTGEISGNGQNSGISDKKVTDIIYYTKSGTKYHLSKDCRYLKRSKEILQGGQDIIKSKKLTPCSACAQ